MWLKLWPVLKVIRHQRLSAGVLLFNGLSGLLVPLVPAVMRGGEWDPLDMLAFTPLLGVVAGALGWRGHRVGFAAGIVFYAIQSFSFFSPAFNISFRSGLSLASVHVLPQGVLVINWAAIVFGVLCGAVLWQSLSRVPDSSLPAI